jgi:hypothetical protein
MEVSGQCHALATSHTGKNWYKLNRRMGGPHSQSEHSGEKEITAPAGNQAPDCPNHSLLTILIMQHQLLEHETKSK